MTVKIEEEGKTTIGQGADTDVTVANTMVYIHALNKTEFKKQK